MNLLRSQKARARYAAEGFIITQMGFDRHIVIAGEVPRVVAEITVNRQFSQGKDYKATMTHNGDILFPYSTVRRAAEAAFRHAPFIPDYQI